MNTRVKSKNLFLKRIARHIGNSFSSQDFFESCETIMGQGGASNFFVYCYDNREFLKKNKDLIKEVLLDFFDSIGELPANYPYTCFGQALSQETIDEILGFFYGDKIPVQGQGCDWLVWASVENEVYSREEEIQRRKWEN